MKEQMVSALKKLALIPLQFNGSTELADNTNSCIKLAFSKWQ